MQNIYFSCKDVLYLQRPILDSCLLIQRAQKYSLGFPEATSIWIVTGHLVHS